MQSIFKPRHNLSALNYLLIAYSIFGFNLISQGQSDKEKCMEQIKKIYEKLNTPTPSSNENPVYYLNYSVNTTLRDGKQGPGSKSSVEVVMNNKQARIISKEISVYQDEFQSFTILPTRKTIYQGAPTLNLDNHTRLNSLSMLQDAIFDVSIVKDCTDFDLEDEKADRRVVVEFDSEGEKRLNMKILTFHLNISAQTMDKIIIELPTPNEIERVEYIFKEINYDYKTDILDQPIRSELFNKDQELLPKYKKFELIDARSPSK